MARISKKAVSSGYIILLADDDPDYLDLTKRLLLREGHEVLTAIDGISALEILEKQKIDLLLLDYFMPGMTGEEVVTKLRKFNSIVQIVLQTGYASEQPPRELLKRLDIQGYFDKSEGPDKLLLWVEVGLKASYRVQLLYKSREGLRYILNMTPDLHKIQQVDDLLQGILLQVSGLLGAVNSFLAVIPETDFNVAKRKEEDNYLVLLEGDKELLVHASTNEGGEKPYLEPKNTGIIDQAINSNNIQVTDHLTIVPLKVGDQSMGVIYLDRPAFQPEDLEILQLFANQAAVAIHNAQLFEMATVDSLTGVYGRGFLNRCLMRELKTAFRTKKPLAYLMVDMDGLKQINDQHGHIIGDKAIAIVGKVLKQACRSSDIIGRYGGDEFSIVLPQADLEAARALAGRIIGLLMEQELIDANEPIPLRCSIGTCCLEPHEYEVKRTPNEGYFQEISGSLIEKSDASLYQAKKEGRNRFDLGTNIHWGDPA